MLITYERAYFGDLVEQPPPEWLEKQAMRMISQLRHPTKVHVLSCPDQAGSMLHYGHASSNPAWYVTFTPEGDG